MVRLVGDAWYPDEGIEIDIPLDEPIEYFLDEIADELYVSDIGEYSIWSVKETEDFDSITDLDEIIRVKRLKPHLSLNSQGMYHTGCILYFTREEVNPDHGSKGSYQGSLSPHCSSRNVHPPIHPPKDVPGVHGHMAKNKKKASTTATNGTAEPSEPETVPPATTEEKPPVEEPVKADPAVAEEPEVAEEFIEEHKAGKAADAGESVAEEPKKGGCCAEKEEAKAEAEKTVEEKKGGCCAEKKVEAQAEEPKKGGCCAGKKEEAPAEEPKKGGCCAVKKEVKVEEKGGCCAGGKKSDACCAEEKVVAPDEVTDAPSWLARDGTAKARVPPAADTKDTESGCALCQVCSVM
eukprot:TRINITY_DN2057_c1_g1_i2.p1 TRINITY_DN2057_c1_g1~~TRINITY_DN2057_c1_g1_i2.p1  ORF type:complete len:369 (+),score=94.78 TRINITY_DN2057_c1_g1_i2:59-1108(+)